MAALQTTSFITPFPANEIHQPIYDTMSLLVDLDTILMAIDHLAEVTAEDESKMGPAWFKYRLDLVQRLGWVAQTIHGSLDDQAHKCDAVLTDHIEFRITT